MPSRVRVGAIDNAGPNTLVAYLRSAGSSVKEIDIAVAFVTAAGIESLLYLLKKAAKQGRVRFLTGTFQGFTEPKALRMLIREQDNSGERISVRISTDWHFHWKAYFLVGKTLAHCVIGSSNLTDDGLRRSGEFNTVLSVRRDSPEFRTIHRSFDHQWQTSARPLTESVLAEYERWWRKKGAQYAESRVPLGRILGGARSIKREQRERSFWRFSVDSFLARETESLLSEITNWDKRGLSYCATWKPLFATDDRIVLFDLESKRLSVMQVVETAHSPVRTPDGSHFAAYRAVRGVPLRRLVPKRWNSLKASGIIRTKADVHRTRRLSQEQYDSYVINLKAAVK